MSQTILLVFNVHMLLVMVVGVGVVLSFDVSQPVLLLPHLQMLLILVVGVGVVIPINAKY